MIEKIADAILLALPHRWTGHVLESRTIKTDQSCSWRGTTVALICLKCPHVEQASHFPALPKPPINVNA